MPERGEALNLYFSVTYRFNHQKKYLSEKGAVSFLQQSEGFDGISTRLLHYVYVIKKVGSSGISGEKETQQGVATPCYPTNT
jgi:hypothetical protein